MIGGNAEVVENNHNSPFQSIYTDSCTTYSIGDGNIDFRYKAYCLGRKEGSKPLNEDLSSEYLVNLFKNIKTKYWNGKEFYAFVCGFLKSCEGRVSDEKLEGIRKELNESTPEDKKINNLEILEEYYQFLGEDQLTLKSRKVKTNLLCYHPYNCSRSNPK